MVPTPQKGQRTIEKMSTVGRRLSLEARDSSWPITDRFGDSPSAYRIKGIKPDDLHVVHPMQQSLMNILKELIDLKLILIKLIPGN